MVYRIINAENTIAKLVQKLCIFGGKQIFSSAPASFTRQQSVLENFQAVNDLILVNDCLQNTMNIHNTVGISRTNNVSSTKTGTVYFFFIS